MTGSAGTVGDGLASEALEFTKMHGLGNDFAVVDATSGAPELDAERIRRLADRHTGIGFDQLLVVAPPSVPGVEFDYRIFNADGTEVEHCGNGARCFARFVHERGLSSSRSVAVHTNAGDIRLELLDDGRVTVMMGVPDFRPERVPFLPEAAAEDPAPGARLGTVLDPGRQGLGPFREVRAGGRAHALGAVAVGNPHAVLLVDDVDTAPVASLGPAIESHPAFPRRVNAGFLQIVTPGFARLRVHERGVGETRACGSGACAALAVGVAAGLLERRARIALPGGELELAWPHDRASIEMTGPCSTVFEGRTRL